MLPDQSGEPASFINRSLRLCASISFGARLQSGSVHTDLHELDAHLGVSYFAGTVYRRWLSAPLGRCAFNFTRPTS